MHIKLRTIPVYLPPIVYLKTSPVSLPADRSLLVYQTTPVPTKHHLRPPPPRRPHHHQLQSQIRLPRPPPHLGNYKTLLHASCSTGPRRDLRQLTPARQACQIKQRETAGRPRLATQQADQPSMVRRRSHLVIVFTATSLLTLRHSDTRTRPVTSDTTLTPWRLSSVSLRATRQASNARCLKSSTIDTWLAKLPTQTRTTSVADRRAVTTKQKGGKNTNSGK